MRGVITDKIKNLSKKMIGREITEKELRLMAYVQYVMMNEQRLDIAKINPEERKILKKWKEEDFIEGGAGGLSICKPFWDLMCEVLWEGYVVGSAELEVKAK